MIKSKELRIGNWIKSDYKSDKFIQVDANIISVIAQLEKDFKDLNFPNGIDLTPEILEKAGFVIENKLALDNVNTYWKDGMDQYLSYHYDGFCVYETTRKLIVKSLHQLQNLYFALTGEELEIQL